MICNKDILFIHVPKTAGMAISQVLLEVLPKPVYYSVSSPSNEEYKHNNVTVIPGKRHEFLQEAKELVNQLGMDLKNFKKIIAVVRNPYEMEVSRYFYLRLGHAWDRGSAQRMAFDGNFENFAIKSLYHGRKASEIYRFFVLDGVIPSNMKILRYENLQADFESTLRDVGIETAKSLPIVNKTKHGHYRDYLTPAAEDAIYKRYKWLFDAGFYQREYKLMANHFKMGNQFIDKGRLEDAISSYRLAIAQNPNFAWYHHNLAEALVKQGQLEEAIAAYRRAIEINPNFASFHRNLAEVLVKQGQFDEAIAAYRRAIEINPNFASFHHNLAQALVKQGQLEESLIFFRKAIELNPNLVLAYRNLPANHSLLYQLGCIFLQQCSKDEAVTCFLKAIQVKSNFFSPYLKLRYLLPLNRLDEVIASCRKAIELQPDFAWADICLGYALTRQGNHDEAIRCFQSASYKQTRISYPSLAEKQCNSNLRSKPNFIICGVAKCGTTSLSQYIFQHPQVIPAIQKEIHFFSYEYSQGLDWYLAQFPSIPEGYSFLTGEASPSYLTYIGAEKRIFEHFPKVKLICLLRNPVDRTISAYYHCRGEGTENRSFEQAICSEIEALKGVEDSPVTDIEIAISRQEIRYLKSSMYFYFIKEWMEIFSSEQLLIVKSEDFYANTAVIMQQVFDFLEIPHYQAAEYKKYMVGSYKPISDNLRRQLSEFFIPHNQKLENYLGRKFNWK